jgi:succinate dehydrogenase / fumarate reductase cytochrome b subunit
MTATAAGPSAARRLPPWRTLRWRDPGWIAFALNRLTGAILVLYLLAHFVVLAQLVRGAEGWDGLLELFGSRPFLIGDVLLIAAVVFHGLNGLRVVALTLGFGTRHSTLLFVVVLVLSAVLTGLAGWRILLA